ncbi:unnamed protein product [Linum tenue]|uniref:Uncharacterized protein n=1 Tax=Linum tenue TaxID=586396 RepID=A0AAV0K4K3_9ROSI|nr:unnamed protein product [Linum tenue]
MTRTSSWRSMRGPGSAWGRTWRICR